MEKSSEILLKEANLDQMQKLEVLHFITGWFSSSFVNQEAAEEYQRALESGIYSSKRNI